MQHEIEHDARIRENNALGRTVRDIAFVPERYVLESSNCVTAHQSSESGNAFGFVRIALVRHGRTALVAFAETLFGFRNFAALQVANFHGDLLECRCHNGKHRKEERVAISLDHLRAGEFDIQVEIAADFFFEFQ